MVVYKYPLKITGNQQIPVGDRRAVILHVGEQNDTLCMWVLLDETSTDTKGYLDVDIFGTGNPVHTRNRHIGTVQMSDGLVWHVFAGVKSV